MRISPVQNDARFIDTVQLSGRSGGLDAQRSERLDNLPLGGPATTGEVSRSGAGTFGQVLGGALEQVNQLQLEADRQAELVATGQAQNPHDAVLAMERADLALQLTIRITEKALAAYQQISQMQI